MPIDPTPNRRTILKTIGAVGALGSIGTVSARPPQRDDDELRLFSEQAVDNAMEVVTQGNHAYVATGNGMNVIDWRNPGRPETVATVDLNDPLEGPSLSVLDVKVDGDLAALANDTEDPGGVALYDISDPASPEFQAFYEPSPPANIHNCYVEGDHVYLGLSEPTNIDTDGDRDLVHIFGDAGVEIVDATDPANPKHAATWMLKEEFPTFAKSGVVPNHDLYVQDDLVYNAFWDAGVVVLDVSNPSDPEFVAQFGEAPGVRTEIRPFKPEEETADEYFAEVFPFGRYLGPPGNAHYVQPSPDGDHLFVGDETFIGPSGIRVFDIRDFSAVKKVAEIDPPDGERLRTAHNFDVTNNRLVSGWYFGGVRVHDITDPSDPEELARYRPDGIAFWTAVQARGFVVGGVYGARSDTHNGGIVVLRDDRGKKQPPAFNGSAPPDDPGMGTAGPDRSAQE